MPDPRLTAARSDLADAQLRGQVEAENFVTPDIQTVRLGHAALRKAPDASSVMVSEILFGETLNVYERKNGWAWVQSQRDSYVGYIEDRGLSPFFRPSHKVSVTSTPLFSTPDIKSPVSQMLPLGAEFLVLEHSGAFARLQDGYVFARHLSPVGNYCPDWASLAEQFIATPYLWGGKSWAGLDCSGLVQIALQAGGITAPRDSDQQEQALGQPVSESIQRGDLIFWRGHVGIALGDGQLLHANAHFMQVTKEPLLAAMARIQQSAGSVTSIRRL